MRRLFTVWLALGLLAMAYPLSAQIKFSKGIIGGANYSDFRGDDSGDTNHRNGFSAGGFFRVSVLGIVALQPEVLYTQKGAKTKDTDGEIDLRINYIEVPVLLRLHLPIVGVPIFPTVFAGPAFSVKLSTHFRSVINGVVQEGSIEDLGGKVKSTDAGFIIGGAFDFGPVDLQVRYILGLSKIDDTAAKKDVKNKVLSLMAGISL